MIDEQTFTIDQIEEQTGFDRRTIAYYVQQGLLPRVGRRGPRTRYPQLFFTRLRFIRMIRDLQDQGAIGSMTLSDFRDLFRSVPEETIAEVVAGRESPQVLAQGPPPDSPALGSSSDRRRAMLRRIEDLRQTVVSEPAAAVVEKRGRPMDPAQEASPQREPEEKFAARAYLRLPNAPRSAEERDTPSGEYHRLTLDAIERAPGAPVLARGRRSPTGRGPAARSPRPIGRGGQTSASRLSAHHRDLDPGTGDRGARPFSPELGRAAPASARAGRSNPEGFDAGS